MKLDELKTKALNRSFQAVMLDGNGYILQSDDYLFPVPQGKPIDEVALFFNGFNEVLTEADDADFPIFYPSIELKSGEQELTTDLHVYRHDKQHLLLIENRTAWYEEFRLMQQERNQKSLENSQLNVTNKHLELERELLKLKNNQMKRLQDFKSDFFSKVSHELRTPISGIIGLSSLLEDSGDNSKETEKYIKSLKTSAGHLQNIVNDVLDISKIESGKFNLNDQPVNLGELIEDVALSFYYQAKEKGLELRTYIANTLPTWVQADATRLKQILYNLLSNAMKFTHEGYIAMHAGYEMADDATYRIIIKVEDSGIGIEPENLKRIFGEYQQATKDTQSKYGGTGLGLSVVKQLVEMYGGKVSVSSIPGDGSIFSFDLMLKKAQNPNTSSLQKFKLLNKNLKVLIADDDSINLMILKKHFAEQTEKCTLVSSAEEALDKAKEDTYDVIISDINMAEKTGIELAYDLKDEPVKVFLLTGDFMAKDHKVYQDRVIERAFLKPVNPNELFAAINDLF